MKKQPPKETREEYLARLINISLSKFGTVYKSVANHDKCNHSSKLTNDNGQQFCPVCNPPF